MDNISIVNALTDAIVDITKRVASNPDTGLVLQSDETLEKQISLSLLYAIKEKSEGK